MHTVGTFEIGRMLLAQLLSAGTLAPARKRSSAVMHYWVEACLDPNGLSVREMTSAVGVCQDACKKNSDQRCRLKGRVCRRFGANRQGNSEMAIDDQRILAIARCMGDVALDPALWPAAMQDISDAVGASGAALLQADVRTPDVPRTAGVSDLFDAYFGGNWHVRDMRARGAPLLAAGERQVITDADVVTAEEMDHSDYYNELLRPHKLRWFAAVGFWAGEAPWALSIHRTARQGPFDASEQRRLEHLSTALTAAATLSRAVGYRVLTGVLDALSLCGHAAIAVDRRGGVLSTNAAADTLLGADLRVKDRQILIRDPRARGDLGSIVAWLESGRTIDLLPVRNFPIRRRDEPMLLCRVIPVPDGATDPFLGAKALLTLAEVQSSAGMDVRLLAQSFGLTPAESKLAALIGDGLVLADAAAQLGLPIATVRNQLKGVFLKTGAHRQGDLIALMQPFRKAR